LVALGYSQIPGVGVMDNSSPVIADSSVILMLLTIQTLNLKARSIDVETAFLNGSLEEEINMKICQGLRVI
jgi:Reverse transcriptase (RNA-dependent DNA polymerase)